jgi:hypothetical protein
MYNRTHSQCNAVESQTLLYREYERTSECVRENGGAIQREGGREVAKQQLGFGNPVHFAISQQN